MNEYPRETVEYQKVNLAVDGVPVTSADGVLLAIAKIDERPESWVAAVLVDDALAVMVSGLEEGRYQVFAQVASPPETPVIKCGAFLVT